MNADTANVVAQVEGQLRRRADALADELRAIDEKQERLNASRRHRIAALQRIREALLEKSRSTYHHEG